MISVIIPASEEPATVAAALRLAMGCRDVTETIVVVDGGNDDVGDLARDAGAVLLTSTLPGKGALMECGMKAASNEVVLFLDADPADACPDIISRMTQPIVAGWAQFAKAKYTAATTTIATLTAQSLLHSFFGELGSFAQPLAGIIAARRTLLQKLRFEIDAGVTVGLLIDSAMFGADVAEVEIGQIKQNPSCAEIGGDLAVQVLRTVLDRAACYGRLQPRTVQELEDVRRYTAAELPVALASAGRPKRLALLNMDGVLVKGQFVEHLAQVIDKGESLAQILDSPKLSTEEQARSVARLFQGIPKSVFEQMAYEVPLIPGAAEFIAGLRKAGFCVGIISDSFHVEADIVRRRVSADFSVGHLLTFRRGAATGNLLLCPAMFHSQGCLRHACCKQNIMLHMLERLDASAEHSLVVGNSLTDTCLLQMAGLSIAFHPQQPEVREAARHVVTGPLRDVLDVLEPT